jgi:DNA-binding NarL/FixJ family response regulator
VSRWAELCRSLPIGEGGTATAAWSALLEGQLTFVECFDDDGHRFVVARRNNDTSRRLTDIERRVVGAAAIGRAQKVVAYEVGLSPARVSELLARALEKLGVSSVTELTRVAAAFGVGRE